MANCPNEFEWDLYNDRELPPERLQELEGHLEGCPACGLLVRGLRQEESLISAALASTPLPPGLTAAIERRLAPKDETAGWFQVILPGLGLAGILAALYSAWWPLLERILAAATLIGIGEFLPRFLLAAAGIMGEAAATAVRGSAVTPAITFLAFCLGVLLMQIKYGKGGRAHV